MNDAQLAVLEARLDEHDRRFNETRDALRSVEVAMKDATAAIWKAVDALRARPQVHPIATTIIATLTTIIGVLATLVALGGSTVKVKDLVERVFWTAISAGLAAVPAGAVLDVASWKLAALVGAAAAVNAVLVVARWRLAVLPDPGDGLGLR